MRTALLEDVGHGGDLTTEAIVAPDRRASARIVARAGGVLAGLDLAVLAFRMLDESIEITAREPEGARVRAGAHLAEITGSARALLTGERTALNLLSRLCGIAGATRRLVDLIEGETRIADTRKTTPGLRALEDMRSAAAAAATTASAWTTPC